MKSKNTHFYRLISSQFRSFFSLAALVSVLILFPFVAHGAEVTLKWDPNSELDLEGYRIYNSKVKGGPYTRVVEIVCGSGETTCTEYTVMGLDDDGTYYFVATAYDQDGNESAYSKELVHDKTPPTVKITTPTSGSTYSTSQSQLSIGGTASDNVAVTLVSWKNSRGGSGTCSGTSNWSKSGIVLSSGQNVITVTARDAAGNTGIKRLTVTYTPPDTTDPTTAFTTPTSGSTYSTSQSQLSIGGTASDNVAVTLVSWKNSRGGSGTCSGTSNWSKSGIVLSSGQNVITVTARDAAGNTGTQRLTVTYTPPDTTDPTTAFTTPTSGSTYSTSQSQLSIGGTASDNVAVTLVSWKNSRGGSGTCSGTSNWSKSGIVLSSGQNVITVTARDAAGNTGIKRLTVTYTPPDTTDPTTAFTTPTSGSTYSTSQSQLSIGGTASDNVAVTLVSWKNSRGGSGTCSGTSNWSKSGIVLSSGQNVITVTARDAAGNTGIKRLTVTYTPPDTTDPTTAFTTPTSGSTYSTSQSQLSIGGTASDNVAVTLVSWKNSRGGSGTCSGTSNWSQSGIVLSSGQNVITVTARDAAGNTGTQRLTVTYTPPDTTPPIEAEDMPIKITGDDCVPISGGVNLCVNGYIAADIDFAAGGTASFEVVAMGSYAGGAWPIMEVRIDQTPVGTVTVDSLSWETYTIQASISRGTHEVAIAFINDDWEDPDDGNLYVDKVTITTENSPPAADAGYVKPVEEGDVVVLDGFNSTDPDDNITGYFWEQTEDGVRVDLTNPGEAEATFIAPGVETESEMLTFQLTVIDAEGLQSTDTCSVQVTKAVSEDRDGDGVPDDQDAFPDDKNEHLDTDRDSIGNNEDEDDDDDGMPDDWELMYDLNPLEKDAGDDPDGDGVSNIDEYDLGTEPNKNEGNFDPYQPLLITPDENEPVSLSPLLETEEFDDPNFNDIHSQTQWEIVRADDEFIVFDVTTESSLTSLTVPKMILDYDTSYIWRVKFSDNYGGDSDWSEAGYFTTEFSEEDSDGDGILDHQEVDDTLDLDKDGVADRKQSDIKCIVANSGNAQIGVSIRDAENVDSILSLEIEDTEKANLVSNSKGKPRFIDFGLLHFKLLLNAPGEETVVTIHLSEAPFGKGKNHKNIKMYKYDPVNTKWLNYAKYAEFSSDRKRVYLTLKDGGFGDADGLENGIIVDPLAFGSDSDPDSGSGSGSGSNSDDSLIPDNISCFITTASARSGNMQPLCNWRDIGTRELLIVFILMVLGYVGTEIFSRFRQKRGDGAKSIGRIAI